MHVSGLMILFLQRGNISTTSKLLSLTISVEATFQNFGFVKTFVHQMFGVPKCILIKYNSSLSCHIFDNNKSQYKTDPYIKFALRILSYLLARGMIE